MQKFILLLTVVASLLSPVLAKMPPLSEKNRLLGTITPQRSWWDLRHYDLSVKVDPDHHSISGTNTVTYRPIESQQDMQIDLQQPMKLLAARQNGQNLTFHRQAASYFIQLPPHLKKGQDYQLTLVFGGKPHIAKNPPWDGGLTWQRDTNGKPFIANANEDIGASIWWPNKDHWYDEPDNGIDIRVEVPDTLMDVSNGRLIDVHNHPARHTKTWHWRVVNPINSYGVNINIGDYVHFGHQYQGEKGPLDMNFYVLRNDLDKAKKQFKQADKMMEALEYWFGPYPFYQDGYKLVEVPYLGMEHQSSVTYGNGFENGYLGKDRSHTGYGLKFDFIIIHESGHEWFANNITAKDYADMWIHESFTNYAEGLYVEYFYGKKAGNAYIRGNRTWIKNQRPIIGRYNAREEGSGDMYAKGANMLLTIRQLVNNDKRWRHILRGLNKTFYHQTVTSKQIEHYLSAQSGIDLSKVFDQYLRDIRIPVLEYYLQDKQVHYHWNNVVKGFAMPVKVTINGRVQWLHPTSKWQSLTLKTRAKSLHINANFYVAGLDIFGQPTSLAGH